MFENQLFTQSTIHIINNNEEDIFIRYRYITICL